MRTFIMTLCLMFLATGAVARAGRPGSGADRSTGAPFPYDDANEVAIGSTPPAGSVSPIPSGNLLYYVPHIISGNGFVTKLTLTNLTNAANQVQVNYLSQTGTVLDTASYTLGASATLRIQTPETDRFATPVTKWGIIGAQGPLLLNTFFELGGGSGQGNITNTIGFNDAPALVTFTIPVEFEPAGTHGSRVVGIALANTGNATNTVSLQLVDSAGNGMATSTVTLPAYAQTAIDLSTLPEFTRVLPAGNFIGTVNVTAIAPVSSIALGDDDGPFFSTPGLASGRSGQLLVPHVVSGGGFVTKVTLVNLSSVANTLDMQFYSEAGGLGDHQIVTLPPMGAARISTSEAARFTSSQAQWATITAPSPAAANIFFELQDPATHNVVNTIGFNDASAATQFTFPVEFLPGISSSVGRLVGLALANPSTAPVSITLNLLDGTGTSVATTALSLAAHAHTSFELSAVPTFRGALPSSTFIGAVTLTSSAPVSALALGDDFGPFYATPPVAVTAGTVSSVTTTVATTGGTVTTTTGNTVSIPGGAFSSGQTVTIVETPTFAPQGIPGIGPGLSIQATAASVGSIQFQGAMTSAQTSATGLLSLLFQLGNSLTSASIQGAAPIADVTNAAGQHATIGLQGSIDPGSKTATASLDPSLVTNGWHATAGIGNLLTADTTYTAAPPGLRYFDGTQWTNPPAGCSSGKVLMLVHGILSDVENAFPQQNDCASSIKAKGGYDTVLGFNYPWSFLDVTSHGSDLSAQLDKLNPSQCPGITRIDVEAHSLGVLVALDGISKTSSPIANFVALGGPIEGTPFAQSPSWISTLAVDATVPTPIKDPIRQELKSVAATIQGQVTTQATLATIPFVADAALGIDAPSPPGGTKTIRLNVAPKFSTTRFFVAAGTKAPLWGTAANIADPQMHEAFDGIIPLSSALATHTSTFPIIPVGSNPPNTPVGAYPVTHTELECNATIVSAVAAAVNTWITVTPSAGHVQPGAIQQYTATISGSPNSGFSWLVVEGSTGGTISGAGLYTAPATPGTYHIRATSNGSTPVFGTATVIVDAPTTTSGLVAWYSFDDSSHPEKDTVNGLNGTAIVGITQATSAVKGNAAHFTDGYMLLPATALLNLLPGDFTLAVFVHSTDSGNRNWFTKADPTNHRYGLGGSSTPNMSFEGGGGGGATATTNVFDGNWHHVAGVKRGNNAEIWVDGKLQNSSALHLTFSLTEGGQFAIGADGACCQSFNGDMDEAKIWNRALSATEIAAEAAHP